MHSARSQNTVPTLNSILESLAALASHKSGLRVRHDGGGQFRLLDQPGEYLAQLIQEHFKDEDEDEPEVASEPEKPKSAVKKAPTNKPEPKKVQANEVDPKFVELRETILEELGKQGPRLAKDLRPLFQAEKDPAESTRLFLQKMVQDGLLASFGRGTGTRYKLKP